MPRLSAVLLLLTLAALGPFPTAIAHPGNGGGGGHPPGGGGGGGGGHFAGGSPAPAPMARAPMPAARAPMAPTFSAPRQALPVAQLAAPAPLAAHPAPVPTHGVQWHPGMTGGGPGNGTGAWNGGSDPHGVQWHPGTTNPGRDHEGWHDDHRDHDHDGWHDDHHDHGGWHGHGWYGGVWYAAPPYYGWGYWYPALPYAATAVVLGGLTYYTYENRYYLWDDTASSYQLVSPPNVDSAVTTPPSNLAPADGLYVYPAQGQSTDQQATDRYECHRWAHGQTGYDPTQPNGGVDPAYSQAKLSDYQRAMRACLEPRGYSVR